MVSFVTRETQTEQDENTLKKANFAKTAQKHNLKLDLEMINRQENDQFYRSNSSRPKENQQLYESPHPREPIMPGSQNHPRQRINKQVLQPGQRQEEDIDLYDDSFHENYQRNTAHRHQLGQMQTKHGEYSSESECDYMRNEDNSIADEKLPQSHKKNLHQIKLHQKRADEQPGTLGERINFAQQYNHMQTNQSGTHVSYKRSPEHRRTKSHQRERLKAATGGYIRHVQSNNQMITGGAESAVNYFQNNASEIGTPRIEAQGGLYEQYDTSLVPSRPNHPQVTANAHSNQFNDFEKLPEVEDEMMRSFPPEEVQPDDYHTYELSGNRLIADPTFQGSSRSIGSSQKYQLLNRLAKGNSNDYNNILQQSGEPLQVASIPIPICLK